MREEWKTNPTIYEVILMLECRDFAKADMRFGHIVDYYALKETLLVCFMKRDRNSKREIKLSSLSVLING